MDLEKIPYRRIVDYICIILATLLPGALLIYLFKIELFYSLPTSKIILLSLSFTMPFLLLNTILALPLGVKDVDSIEEAIADSLSWGALITSIIFYISIAISYFKSRNLHIVKVYLLALEVIATIILIFVGAVVKISLNKRKGKVK
jgi:hypothetical protein